MDSYILEGGKKLTKELSLVLATRVQVFKNDNMIFLNFFISVECQIYEKCFYVCIIMSDFFV